ncbi:MAG: hypothetical protein JJT96_10910 [Opitutales bacterium]|nr:hypothetical protein [Opitutales bacterium]
MFTNLSAILRYMLTSTFFWVGIVLTVFWQFYLIVAPSEPPYTGRQEAMARQAAAEVARALGELPLPREGAVFANLRGDDFGFVSYPLYEAVFRSDVFFLADRSFGEKLRKRIGWTLPTAGDPSEVARRAESRGARFVVGGELERLREIDGLAEVVFTLRIWDLSEGVLLWEDRFEAKGRGGQALIQVVREGGGSRGTWKSMLVLLMGITFAPLLVAPFHRPLLKEGSNFSVLAALVALILFNLLLTVWIFQRFEDGFWVTPLLVLVFLASVIYNYRVLVIMKERL